MSSFISRPSFVLRDDTRLHMGVGIAFLVIGVAMLIFRPVVWILWGGLFLCGGTAIWRARRNRVLVEIGPNGIWAGQEFITDWAQFVRARITTETIHEYRSNSKTYQILEIDHAHESGGVYRRRLNVSDAPHYNEEKLMEAIAHFQGSGEVQVVPGQGKDTWVTIKINR
jgi:hypothetical protein